MPNRAGARKGFLRRARARYEPDILNRFDSRSRNHHTLSAGLSGMRSRIAAPVPELCRSPIS